MSWGAPAGEVAGYKLFRNGGTTPIFQGTNTSFDDTGLDPAQAYQYAVQAYDSQGHLSATSTFSLPVAPPSVTNLTATADFPGRVDMAWNFGSAAVDGFRIERSSDAGQSYSAIAYLNDPATRSYFDRDLPSNYTYRYRVIPFNIRGEGQAVSSGDVTTQVHSSEYYFNNFEDTQSALGDEWSINGQPSTSVPQSTTLATDPAHHTHFIGEFVNDEVHLNLADLPEHSQITIAFDLFILRSWDGSYGEPGYAPDEWELSADDSNLIDTTFYNFNLSTADYVRQAYPNQIYDNQLHPAYSGSVEHGTLGYRFDYGNGPEDVDAVYHISKTFDHTADAVDFMFKAGSLLYPLQQRSADGTPDESWGLDNVNVSLNSSPPAGGAVGGEVWLDSNRNRRLDVDQHGPLESGVSGQRVYVDVNNNGSFDTGEPSAISAPDGKYLISGLSAGTYHLRLVPSTGNWLSYPWADAQDVTIADGQTVDQVNFGVLGNAAPVLGTLNPPPIVIDPYTAVPPQLPPLWGKGDVFLTTFPDERLREYTPDHQLVRTLPQTINGAVQFDAEGDILASVYDQGEIVKLSATDGSQEVVASGLASPTAITVDALGNIYVSCRGNVTLPQSGGVFVYDGGIYKFDRNFNLVGHWLDSVDVDSLAMTTDQHTVLYSAGTLWGTEKPQDIHSLDLNTSTDSLFAGGNVQIGGLRILADGNVLATDWNNIKLFSPEGSLLQSYDLPGTNTWFAINVDPDGLSFWAADGYNPDPPFDGDNSYLRGSGQIARFDIETGRVLSTYDGLANIDQTWDPKGDDSGGPRGLTVYGEQNGANLAIGKDFVYRVPASDPDNDAIRFELVGDSHGATIDPGTGVLRWSPPNVQIDTICSFTVKVTDAYGATHQEPLDVHVTPYAGGENHAPVIQTTSLSDATAGATYQNRIVATDEEDDRLTFSLVNAQDVSIDATTGVLSWLPTDSDLQRGQKVVTVRVTDARGATAERVFTVHVRPATPDNDTPVITPQDSDWHFQVGQEGQFTINTSDEQFVNYYPVSILSGMRLENQVNSNNRTLVWTPTANQIGRHIITIAVGDNAGGYTVRRFTVIVDPVAAAIAAFPKVLAVAPGETVDYLSSIAYDASGQTLDSGPISWSWVTNASGGTLDASTGLYHAGSTPADDVIRVTFGSGSTAVHDDIKIEVAAAGTHPLIGMATSGLTATQAQDVNFAGTGAVGYLGMVYDDRTDLSVDDYNVDIDWGDGGPHSSGHFLVRVQDTSIPESVRQHLFYITGDHSFSQPRTSHFKITVSDGTRTSPTIELASGQGIVVTRAPIALTPLWVSATVGQEFNGFVATFSDSSNQATTFAATIDWGDGHTSDGIITRDSSGTYSVQGTHTYTTRGAGRTATISLFEVNTSDNSRTLRASAQLDVYVGESSLPTPTGVVVTAVSQSQVQIRWNGVRGADGYVVRRYNPDGTVVDLPNLTQSTVSNPYYDSSLLHGTRYGYQVLASDQYRTLSAPSPIFYVTTNPDTIPNQPANVTVTPVSLTAIRIAWSANPNDPDVQGWDILRADSASGNFTSILPGGQEVTDGQYVDVGLTPNTQYWYEVVSIGSGEGAPRSTPFGPVDASTTVPTAPKGLAVGYAGYFSDSNTRRIGLKWNPVDGVGLLGYDIYRSTNGASFALNASTLIGSSADARYTDDITGSSTQNQHYYYAVRAVYDGFDGGETSSDPSQRVEIDAASLYADSAPAAADQLVATDNAPDHVTIAWRDNSLNEAGYNIYRNDHGVSGLGNLVGRVTADATSFTDTSVSPAGDYDYYVVAYNHDHTSASAALHVSVTAAGSGPSAPTALTKDLSTTTFEQIGLHWTAPSSSTPAVTGYYVYRQIQLAGGGSVYVRLTPQKIIGTSFVDTELSASTIYHYKVTAVSAAGAPSSPLENDLSTDSAPAMAPIVKIVSPAAFDGVNVDFTGGTTDDTRIRKLTAVKVFVDDVDPADNPTWELTLRPLASDGGEISGQDIKLASGSGRVGSRFDDAGVGVYNLDPSLYPNGNYKLILTASNSHGISEPAETVISLFSNNKFGNLTLPATDLTFDVPGGQPIVIKRVYDSTRANQLLDFGYGWSLGTSSSVLSTTATSTGNGQNLAFKQGDVVYINLPDGSQHAFQFFPVPNNYNIQDGTGVDPYGLGYSHYWAQFIAVDGSDATLTVAGDMHAPVDDRLDLVYDPENQQYRVSGGIGGEATGDTPYDPALPQFGVKYIITMSDGTAYSIDGASGAIEWQKDSNGNKTSYGPRSIQEGKYQVTINRLASDQLRVQLEDSNGHAIGNYIDYFTDAAGNLVHVQDLRAGTDTYYRYGDPVNPHLLTKVIDPRNVVILTAAYDTTGRLISLQDAGGAQLSVSNGNSDGSSGGEVVVDPTPEHNTTENVYDEHGNVVRQIKTVTTNGNVVGYQVTATEYDTFSGGVSDELLDIFDVSDSTQKQPGTSRQNAVASMREYAPFFVSATDTDPDARYNKAPTRLVRETTFSQDGSRMPTQEIEYLDQTTSTDPDRRITTFSDYSHGKPGTIKVTLERKDINGNLIAMGDPSTSTPYYDSRGNVEYEFTVAPDGSKEGTHFLYTDGRDGLPAGRLLDSYKVTAIGAAPLSHLTHNEYYSATETDISQGQYPGALKLSRSGDNGRTTYYSYDVFGRVTRTYYLWENPTAGQPDLWVVNTNYYDGVGRVTHTTQATYEDGVTAGVLGLSTNASQLDANGNRVIIETPAHGVQAGQAERTIASTSYDALGRVDSTTDQFGGTTYNYYDIHGNLIRVQYPDNTETRSVYDEMGRVSWQTDRFRPGDFRSSEIPVPGTHTVYDSLGRVTLTERVANLVITYDFDESFEYEGTAPQVQKTILIDNTADPDHPRMPLSAEGSVFDQQGRVVETDRYAGASSALYSRSDTVYYDDGRVQYTGPLNLAAPSAATRNFVFQPSDFQSYTSYLYDQFDQTAGLLYDQVIDGRTHHTDTYKDSQGRVVKVVFDDGTSTQTLYGVGGQSVTGHVVSGQPITGQQITKIDQRGVTTDYFYDAQGRLTDVWLPAVTDADPNSATFNQSVRPHWHYAYDEAGNQISQTDPYNHTTTFDYDELGQRIGRTLPGGQHESWTYDVHGQVQTHTDFKGQTTLYVYDTRGRETFEYRFAAGVSVDPLSISGYAEYTQYFYDDAGHGNVNVGVLSQVREYAHESGGDIWKLTTDYAYDLLSGAVTRTAITHVGESGPFSVVNHAYDPATGLLIETWTGDASDPATSTTDTLYGYDDQGRLKSVSSARINGSTAATPQVSHDRYDALGNAVTTTLPTTLYSYDPVGDLYTVALPNGDTTTYDYDDLNRLHQETVTDANDAILDQFTYTLRADGLRESVQEHRLTQATPSGQQPSFSDTTITWDYDEDGRLKSEFHDEGTLTNTPNVPNDAGDYLDTYAYDLNGNRMTKGHVFYDGSGSHAQTTEYEYDSGGDDRLMSESTVDEDNQPITSTTYSYDDNGSQIEKQATTETASSDEKFAYDLRNHLVRYDATGNTQYDENGNPLPSTETGGVDTAADDTTYRYDSDGNRIEKSDSSGTTIDVTDTRNPTGYQQVLEEKDEATGDAKVTYIIGSGVLGQVRAGNSYVLEYFLSDGHGSTREMLNADGNPLADTSSQYLHQEYDAFGNFTVAAIPTTRLYVPLGGAWDDSLGMYHFNARDYRAVDGVWSSFDYGGSTDPNTPLSLHKYIYANGNPIIAIDPTGKISLVGTLVTAGISGLIGGITNAGIHSVINVLEGKSWDDNLWSTFFKGAISSAVTTLCIAAGPVAATFVGNFTAGVTVDWLDGDVKSKGWQRVLVTEATGAAAAAGFALGVFKVSEYFGESFEENLKGLFASGNALAALEHGVGDVLEHTGIKVLVRIGQGFERAAETHSAATASELANGATIYYAFSLLNGLLGELTNGLGEFFEGMSR